MWTAMGGAALGGAARALGSNDDDDDTFEIVQRNANLTWADIAMITATVLPAALCLVAFYLYARAKKSAYHLVFFPRVGWEARISDASTTAGGDYVPISRAHRKGLDAFDWVKAVWTDDGEILRHCGLEMYVFLRFTRLCLKLTAFGSLNAIALCAVYATATSDGRSTTSRVAWYRFTLANVDYEANASRLWAPAVFLVVLTLHFAHLVTNECHAFVELRQEYFTKPPANADPFKAEQILRSVMIERVPPQLRSAEALRQHFVVLFGEDKVHSAAVPSVSEKVEEAFVDAERCALEIERLVLKRNKTGVEPVMSDVSLCGKADSRLAIPVLAARLEQLNAKLDDERVLVDDAGETRPPGDAGESADAKDGDDAGRLSDAFNTAVASVEGWAVGGGASTGFVTFTDLITANVVRQMQLMPRPNCMISRNVCPDDRDLIWKNVAESQDGLEARKVLGDVAVSALALNWTVLISAIYTLSSWSTLEQLGLVEGRGSYTTFENELITYFTTVAPVCLLSLALALLPLMLDSFSVRLEKLKLRSDVDMRVLERNFALQMLNLWWTVFAGSFFSVLDELLHRPSDFFELVGVSLPLVSVYFTELIIIKATVGLAVELARAWPWARMHFAKRFAGGSLAHRDRNGDGFLRPAFSYATNYTSVLMVAVIALLFAVIAPLVYPFALVFFAVADCVYTHNALHVYVPYLESGGAFFFPVIFRLVYALVGAQATVVAFLAVKLAWAQAAGVLLLCLVTLGFAASLRKTFGPPCLRASLQVVSESDRLLFEEHGRIVAGFDAFLYEQPAIRSGESKPVHDTQPADEGEDAPLLTMSPLPFAAQDGALDTPLLGGGGGGGGTEAKYSTFKGP
ncbi:hypothetical protein M885DRAFT_159148 [Pelagophyceae sp. CCMP2097]|nr:hypothetical protein M885DRAFT_159148 [Pelagophyceae sp. CCMP2097]